MLASRGRSGHWELPSLSHGDDMVVEGVVVWKMPQPSLALEAVIASDPSVGGDPRAWVQHLLRLASSYTELCQALALLEWQPTLSHDAVPPPLP